MLRHSVTLELCAQVFGAQYGSYVVIFDARCTLLMGDTC